MANNKKPYCLAKITYKNLQIVGFKEIARAGTKEELQDFLELNFGECENVEKPCKDCFIINNGEEQYHYRIQYDPIF